MTWVTVCAVFVLVASAAGISFSQDDVAHVADTAFRRTMRPPVAFLHDDHNEKAGIEECSVCHHVYDEGGNLVDDESSEEQECSECHLSGKSGGKLALIRQYHLRCKGCHENERSGPVMCGECHVKP